MVIENKTTLTVTGLEQLRTSIRKLPDLIRDRVVNEMLDSGGEIIKAEMVEEIGRQGLVDTRQLEESVAVEREPAAVIVYPQGKRKARRKERERKVREGKGFAERAEYARELTNAELAFVLEYGDSARRGSGWLSAASENAEKPIEDMVDEILEDALHELFGGN